MNQGDVICSRGEHEHNGGAVLVGPEGQRRGRVTPRPIFDEVDF